MPQSSHINIAFCFSISGNDFQSCFATTLTYFKKSSSPFPDCSIVTFPVDNFSRHLHWIKFLG